MKTLVVSLLLITAVCIVPQATQSSTIQTTGTLENLLVNYLQIKNTLVKSQNIQSLSADFLKTVKAVNGQNLSEKQKKAWTSSSANIIKDLEGMAATEDLEKQRKHFASLSQHFYPLVKTMEHTTPLYYQYCPMYGKGAYWISELPNIQNPYFGNQMLTCGSTKETIH